jgi:hypothetical protein
MSKNIVFIQIHGKPGIHEAELPIDPTVGDLHAALEKLSIVLDANTVVFIDEHDEHDHGDRQTPMKRVKHGCRIHVSRCRHIKTTVHYLEKTIEHQFSPGARVRTVKAWVVEKLKIDEKDAGEHVLRICNSTREPATDTPLHELTEQGQCSVCFDFVPVKRVEG